MMLRKWDDIPEYMRCEEVRGYYDILYRKRGQLYVKRVGDITLALLLILILAIPMIVISVVIRLDSPGNAMFLQERVTSYGRTFLIHKFRTMVDAADLIGSTVTIKGDTRITRAGKKLRSLRLDELPQLFDVLSGNMTFVGTRAEVPKYVEYYSNEMYATLLLPAGITSRASIEFKDEALLLEEADDADREYVERVLPEKMRINLAGLKEFSLFTDLQIMIQTIVAVLK